MRTLNLAVAVTLALGLAACAEDVEDPIPADPGPMTYTPVEYAHSGEAPVTPVEKSRIAEKASALDVGSLVVLQKPDFPQPPAE